VLASRTGALFSVVGRVRWDGCHRCRRMRVSRDRRRRVPGRPFSERSLLEGSIDSPFWRGRGDQVQPTLSDVVRADVRNAVQNRIPVGRPARDQRGVAAIGRDTLPDPGAPSGRMDTYLTRCRREHRVSAVRRYVRRLEPRLAECLPRRCLRARMRRFPKFALMCLPNWLHPAFVLLLGPPDPAGLNIVKLGYLGPGVLGIPAQEAEQRPASAVGVHDGAEMARHAGDAHQRSGTPTNEGEPRRPAQATPATDGRQHHGRIGIMAIEGIGQGTPPHVSVQGAPVHDGGPLSDIGGRLLVLHSSSFPLRTIG
jgi:hypothetical protein